MKRCVIIPARGGSKRLPGKNLKTLGVLPLICWTVREAIQTFDNIIVTSDSQDILEIVKSTYGSGFNKNVGYSKRPEELSGDTSKVIDTVSYYFDLADKVNPSDEIWLMLPTCPLRTKDDILHSQDMLKEDGVDSILSITEPEFPPSLFLKETEEGLITGLDPSHPFASGNSRSQDQPMAYRPNGAIYGSKWESFRKYRNFYKGNVKGHFMPRERSVDIDTKLDFDIAQLIVGGKKGEA